MIIQFNLPAAGSVSSPDTHSQAYDSLNWIHDQSNQNAFSECASPEENGNKIFKLELACPEDPTLLSNYVEEVESKRFKGPNSIALFVPEGSLVTALQRRADHGVDSWNNPMFLDGCAAATSIESLPDAA